MTDAPPQIYFRGIEPDSQFNYRDPLGASWELGFKVSLSLSEVTIFILRSTRIKRPRGSGRPRTALVIHFQRRYRSGYCHSNELHDIQSFVTPNFFKFNYNSFQILLFSFFLCQQYRVWNVLNSSYISSSFYTHGWLKARSP